MAKTGMSYDSKKGLYARTQISPVAHAGEDNNALPEVAGHIANFTYGPAEDEADGLVSERREE